MKPGGPQAIAVLFFLLASLVMAWGQSAFGLTACLVAMIAANRAFVRINPPPTLKSTPMAFVALGALVMLFVSAWMQSMVGVVAYAAANVFLSLRSRHE